MQKRKTSESEELYGELGQAFNFTQGDLEANRAGFLSFRQQILEKGRIVSLGTLAVMVLLPTILCLFAVMLLFIFVVSALCPLINCESVQNLTAVQQIISCLVAILTAYTFIFITVMTMKSMHDLRFRRVQKLLGRVSIERNSVKGVWIYYLVCGKDKFELTEAQYSFNWKKLPYSLYYLPKSKQIISIKEALPE